MATTRTVNDIIQDAIDFISSQQPNIATQVGSVVRDVSIAAPAQEFERSYVELTRVSQIQSLNNPDSMTTEEMDSLGANWSLTRNGGTASQTTTTFRVVGLSTSESNINIPSGTVVTTQQTANAPLVSFSTTQSGTIVASAAASYFNPFSGFYEITLPVQAQTTGLSGNVFAGAISVLSSSIPRIFSVTNTVAATGGTDQESNQNFALRIKTKLAGNNLGTPSGLASLARANVNVLDVSVVGPDDPAMLRNEFGGSIDMYVVGSTLGPTTDTITFNTSNARSIVLLRQPALVTAGNLIIQGLVGGSAHTFVEDTDYSLVSDPTILVDGSTQVRNGFQFLGSPGVLPDNNTQYTVNYSYDTLIETLQAVFDDVTHHIVASDVLVKQAHTALIDIAASVAVIPGFNPASTISAAQTSLTNFLTTNKLGQTFTQSQIAAIIEDTPGVDEVDLSTLVIKKNNVVISTQKTTVGKNEVIEVNTINLALLF